MVTPRGTKAPKLWPAEPRKVRVMVPSGSPAAPCAGVISEPSRVPTVRSTLVMASSIDDRGARPRWPVGRRRGTAWSRARSSPWSWSRVPVTGGVVGRVGHGQDRRRGRARPPSSARRPRSASSRSARPTASSSERRPRAARCSRTSSAMYSKKVVDELGLAVEALAQLGVLGGDAHRAGVEVADPHHDAARHHQRGGGEAELLGPEQGADDDVAPGLHLPVDLDHDPVPQAVDHQGLLGLGQAQLPGDPGVLERGERGRPRCRRRGPR